MSFSPGWPRAGAFPGQDRYRETPCWAASTQEHCRWRWSPTVLHQSDQADTRLGRRDQGSCVEKEISESLSIASKIHFVFLWTCRFWMPDWRIMVCVAKEDLRSAQHLHSRWRGSAEGISIDISGCYPKFHRAKFVNSSLTLSHSPYLKIGIQGNL